MEGQDGTLQTVEIIKQPGQTLGFYIREGNGINRWTGVFISRIAPGSVVAANGVLHVGDEILSVNGVDVTHTRLDDVVVLMSIPKRLVLDIRVPRPACGDARCANAACGMRLAPVYDDHAPAQQPVVVLKSGFNNAGGGGPFDDRSPDEPGPTFGRGTLRYGGAGGDPAGNYGHYYSSTGPGDVDCVGVGSAMHTLPPAQARYSGGLVYSGDPTLPASYVPAPARGGPSYRSAPGVAYSTIPRSAIDYASDTDVGYYGVGGGRTNMGSRYVMRSGSSAPRPIPQDRLDRTYNGYDDGRGGLVNGGLSLGSGRASSFDQYNSDSEVYGGGYPLPRSAAALRSMSASVPTGADDRPYSTSQYYGGYSSADENESWNGKFDSLTLSSVNNPHLARAKPAGSGMDVRSYGDRSPGLNSRRDGYLPIYDDYELRFNRAVSPAAQTGRTGPATAPRPTSAGGAVNHRLTRKMSADSLVAYRTYQPDSDRTSGDVTSDSLRAAASRGSGASSAVSRTSAAASKSSSAAAFNGNGGSTAYSTMTLSRAQQLAGRARTPAGTSSTSVGSTGAGPSGSGGGGPSTAAKLRSLQLARKPLQIQTESFRPCQATGSQSVSSQSLMGSGVSGAVLVHVYCAHGLRSTSFRTTLRDLYCVVEIDAVSRARTMVRTGAINFDWDEAFDVDLDAARRLSFLVYSWDPHVRHRLCFSGVVPLSQLLDGHHQRLAVALEPKGVLYVELDYRDAATTLRRTPAVRRDAVFGVALGELVARERSTLEVPAVVQRCVEEVERRGMDHVGIYRLCGSAKRKQQLREELERDPLGADLSPEAISDINVVTSVLKEFLRELPEPLCSDSLYQMLMDALNVQISGDVDGNARLMLGVLDCLPAVNQDTLTYLLDHLKRVAVRSDVNKMTTLNLAVCFGPAVVCPSPHGDVDLQPTDKLDKHVDLLKYLLDIWPETRDVNATVDRLRAGTSGSRFETVDFRSESGGVGGGAVTSSSDVIKTSTSPHRDEDDDDDDDDLAALVERAQLEHSQPTATSRAWDMSESSPC